MRCCRPLLLLLSSGVWQGGGGGLVRNNVRNERFWKASLGQNASESMSLAREQNISDYHQCALSARPSITQQTQGFSIFRKKLAGVLWPAHDTYSVQAIKNQLWAN